MKRVTRTAILIVLALVLPGCREAPTNTPSKLMVAIGFNQTDSALPEVGPDSNAPLVTDQIIWTARQVVKSIFVFAIAKQSSNSFFPVEGGRYQEVMLVLQKKRLLQGGREESGSIDGTVTPESGNDAGIWGYGTDHAAALKKVAENRTEGSPLLLVLFTDGFNENRPFDEISPQIDRLFKQGPTRLIILGVSQRIVNSDLQLTQLDLWRAMLDGLRLKNLRLTSGKSGYYLSSDVALPSDWKEFP